MVVAIVTPDATTPAKQKAKKGDFHPGMTTKKVTQEQRRSRG
jgi:hypothetical protein